LLSWISENKLIIDNGGQIHYEQTQLQEPIRFVD
jgi:hypothetical protein